MQLANVMTVYNALVLMQVVWLGRPIADSTWEPESTIPPSLVREYEAGILREIHKQTFTTGGQTVHTLSASAREPNVKRPRTDLFEHNSFFYLDKALTSTRLHLCILI